METNLAKQFTRTVQLNAINNATSADIEALKEIARKLLEQNNTLQDMLQRELAINLGLMNK